MAQYDVIIVGAGPAGIFAALELSKKKRLKILMVEKGSDIDRRPRSELFCGWGGAGTFSDGKLNLTGDVGGILDQYLDHDELAKYIDHVDSEFLRFGAPTELKGTDSKEIAPIKAKASKAGLRLVSFPIRHLGTDRCINVLKNIREELEPKVDILTEMEAEDLILEADEVKGVITTDGAVFYAPHVVLAPGRAGSQWLEKLSADAGLTKLSNHVDIGVRVEVPAAVLSPITDLLHEAKFIFNSKRFDDTVRTFCMNPYGVVVAEESDGLSTVNGHSFSTRKSENTNFAILVSTTFTEPFDEPISYGRYIARLANMLGGGIIVQRLGDLLAGRRSTPSRLRKSPVVSTLESATPGDLSFAIPYRHLANIVEMLEALDKVAPGINSPSTLIYGVEVKFYSMRLKLTGNLETEVGNLYAVGDGAGVTRGIMQAAVSGVVAAREILKRV